MCMMTYNGRHNQGVFPPHLQGSQNRLQINHNPDQDEVVTEDEHRNECLIWIFGLFLRNKLELYYTNLSLIEINF